MFDRLIAFAAFFINVYHCSMHNLNNKRFLLFLIVLTFQNLYDILRLNDSRVCGVYFHFSVSRKSAVFILRKGSVKMDFNENYIRENAIILLRGLWYSELPPVIDFDSFTERTLNALKKADEKASECFVYDDDGFIKDFRDITSPEYIRAPGTESIAFYDFKYNGSLREMQIPNLRHYMSFIYNTLFEYEPLFAKLYLDENYREYVQSSASYLMFEETFEIHSEYDDSVFEIESGVFAEKNNKISGSAMLDRNRQAYFATQDSHLFKLKMDVESFFPNLYTHYFSRIADIEPFSSLEADKRYFDFLDTFHQKINDNQTKGVPAGVFSSHVAAELCMLCIDRKINELIENTGISYVRYVDDFTFFADSVEELEKLKLSLQQILNTFRLRVNGNKTEIIPCIYDLPQIDKPEMKRNLFWLFNNDVTEQTLIRNEDITQLQKYIADLIKEKRYPQIKLCLSLLRRRAAVAGFEEPERLLNYMIQLSQTECNLASRAYGVMDTLIQSSGDDYKERFINKLAALTMQIDERFPDTVLQIWHYYTLVHNSPSLVDELIGNLNIQNSNPVILSLFVKSGTKTNMRLFTHIVDEYKAANGRNDWKQSIINSKYWLPLFVISINDGYDYERWYSSEKYPDILKVLATG